MTAHKRLATAHAARNATSVALERLPTNTTTGAHPVHRWFNFIAGFSPEFVQACVSMQRSAAGEPLHLLDPFAGCGTALVAARTMNLQATGYDPHPFFSIISEAKANSGAYWPQLPEIRASIEEGLARPHPAGDLLPPPALAFLAKLFDPAALDALLGARVALERDGLARNPLAFLILSRALDHSCLAATDGIYKAPTSKKRSLPPEDAAGRVFEGVLADRLEAVSGRFPARTYCMSSETMADVASRSVDLVVTSPPYLNNFDFAEMTRMYLYFWGMAGSWSEITAGVRSKLIVNTTTALKGHKDIQGLYRARLPSGMRGRIDDVVATLADKNKVKAGKKDYDLLVYPYLSQMMSSLQECLRVMKPGAGFHMMISDAALYGVHLPAPQWIAEIMASCGYADVECHIVRPRGHRWVLDKREGAEAGLGEYYVFGMAN
jgi:hypothetical protein